MTKCFLFSIGKKANEFSSTTFLQHFTGGFMHCSKAKQWNKRHRVLKGRSKTLFFCRQYNFEYRHSMNSTKQPLGLICMFNKIRESKLIMQNSSCVSIFYQWIIQNEIKNTTSFTVKTKRKKYFWNKIIQIVILVHLKL